MGGWQNTPGGMRGWWVVLAGGIITEIPVSIFSSINPAHTMDIKDVPWYFIYQDFYNGLGALIGLTLSISLSIATWKRYRVFSHMNLWMTILWQGCHAMVAAYIFYRCRHLFDPSQAVAPWKNFDEFRNDRVLSSTLHTINASLSFAIAFLWSPYLPELLLAIRRKMRKTSK